MEYNIIPDMPEIICNIIICCVVVYYVLINYV